VKQLLPDARIHRPFWAYLAALLLVLAAAIQPAVFTYPAALALGVTGVWLGVNLGRVWWRYHRVLSLGRPSPSVRSLNQ
jgi:hypothetical protein